MNEFGYSKVNKTHRSKYCKPILNCSMISGTNPQFRIALAETADDLRAAQQLRYDVFVRELGGGGHLLIMWLN